MKHFKSALGVIFALILTLFMVRNRTPVNLDFWPLPYTMVDVPVFFVFFAGLLLGVFLAWVMHLALSARNRMTRQKPQANVAEDKDADLLDDL